MSIILNKKGYLLFFLIILVLLYYNYNSNTSHLENNKLSIISLLQTAIEASEAGGHFVVKVKNGYHIHSKGKTEEGVQDSVTDADFLSHCSMKNIILTKYPSIKFISEEKDTKCVDTEIFRPLKSTINQITDEQVDQNDITIWIDPLDATKEYTEKLYNYVTTMVCVAIKGKPIIGVIHKPFENYTYWAVVGKGYSSNLSSNKLSDEREKLQIIVSRSHKGNIETELKKYFDNAEVITAAGSGYKVLKVARNDVDAYIHTTAIKKWDICAGNAILNALGGKLTTKNGKELTYFDDKDVVNKEGLIATLRHHNLFVNKI